MKKKYYKVKKYRVQKIKDCNGTKLSKRDIENSYGVSFSTDDINEAHRKLNVFQERIATTGKHSGGSPSSYYGYGCRGHKGKPCKAQFDIREMW